MTAQLDLALAERYRGISKVAAKNQTFIATLRGVARQIARSKGTVCADDLRKWADENGHAPTSCNAWGAIFCRNPDFELAGYKLSEQKQGRGNLQRIWRLKCET